MKKLIFIVLMMASISSMVRADILEFPDPSFTPNDRDLTTKVLAKVYYVKLASGVSWRLEFNSNGYFFVNVSNGFSDSGTWRVEAGRLCAARRNTQPVCNEVRIKDDKLFLKREDGEIIQYM